MGTLTIRLSDEKHEKLRQLATRRKISINQLIEELSTIALLISMPRLAFALARHLDRRNKDSDC